jgi:quinol monooxygenase YgiN
VTAAEEEAMLVVAGIIRIDPKNRALADAAFEKVRAGTLTEPGCLEYQAYSDRSDPGIIFMFEKWASEEALAKHFQTPHMAEFGAAMGGFGVKGMDVKKYEVAKEGPVF